jgi:ferritin-like metal-binding protein YciE
MPKESKKLDVLFHDTLKDIYYAEKKILAALPKMAKATHTDELRAAFEKRAAIEGIIEEGQEIMKEYKGSPALDAGLLAAAQAVEHYEISRYGTLRTWAEELGLDDAAGLLKETLDEEKETDETLTDLAETLVNQEAQEQAAA